MGRSLQEFAMFQEERGEHSCDSHGSRAHLDIDDSPTPMPIGQLFELILEDGPVDQDGTVVRSHLDRYYLSYVGKGRKMVVVSYEFEIILKQPTEDDGLVLRESRGQSLEDRRRSFGPQCLQSRAFRPAARGESKHWR